MNKENVHFDDRSKQVVFLFFITVFSKMNRKHAGQSLRFESPKLGHYRNVREQGKSMVFFRLFEKLRYSNERSTIF